MNPWLLALSAAAATAGWSLRRAGPERRVRARLRGITEFLRATGRDADLDAVYPRALAAATRAIPAAHAASLIVREGSHFHFKAAVNYRFEDLRRVRLPLESVLEPRRLVSGNTYRVHDPAGLTRSLSAEDARVIDAGDRTLRDSISGAAIIGGELHALITVDRFAGRAFTAEDVRLLGSLADHLAAIINNARIDARARELEVLRERFAATAQHELRTPTTAILGYVELLLENPPDPGLRRFAMQTVHAEAQQLARTIEGLTRFGRAEDAAPGATADAERVVLELNAQYAERARERRVNFTAATGALPPVAVAASALRDALAAILENAVTYTPAGGAIDVTARAEGGRVIVRVRDTGIGLAADDLERVFEPFYRVTSRPEVLRARGSGTGLASARQALRGFGGDAYATSDGEGHGSTFVVVIPVALDASVA